MPPDEAPAQAAATTDAGGVIAGASAPPAAALPTPSPDETAGQRLERHIKTAIKKGKAAEAPAAPRGEKGRFAKRGEAAAAEPVTGGAEPPKPGKAERAKPAAEPAGAGEEPSLKKARALFDSGDLDGAFREAFGKLPQDLKIDSRKWEEWRKANGRAKKDLAQREAAAREAVTADRRQLQETLAAAQRTYGPLIEADKLFKAGDFAGALKAGWGVDVATFNKNLLAQHHGKNPEVEALKQRLEERERRDAERQEREAAERQQATQREQLEAYIEERRSELVDGDDPELAGLATKPRFMQRVFQILRDHYDGQRTLPTAVAAGMVRDEIVAEFGPVFGRGQRDTAVPVESAQPGSKAASSGKRPSVSTSLPQRGAAEASAPGRTQSVNELLDKYTRAARAEMGTA